MQRTYGQGSGGLYTCRAAATPFGDRIAEPDLGGPDTYIADRRCAPGYQGLLTFPDGTSRYAIAPGARRPTRTAAKTSTDTYDHTEDAFQTGHYTDNSIRP